MTDPAATREALKILAERYGEALPDILTELQTLLQQYNNPETLLEEHLLTVPAKAFATALTPLETTATYLYEHHALTPSRIAKLLRRTKSTVDAALYNSQKKFITPTRDDTAEPRIPVSAFHNKKLSPGEAIILNLHEQGIKNSDVARLLNRDPRNTHKLLQRAKKKGGAP